MRLVDADKLRYKHSLYTINTTMPQSFPCITKEEINKAPTVEAIPKEQYEARLKSDMVAILVELQLEIEEIRLDRPLMSRGHECYGFEDKTPEEIQQECSEIIQDKINKLKDKEDKTIEGV